MVRPSANSAILARSVHARCASRRGGKQVGVDQPDGGWELLELLRLW